MTARPPAGRSVALIWAQSESGVIGRGGGIPWQLPEDHARFRRITLGHTVVMGRRTWESLAPKVRPLPGRRNVVLTRQAGYLATGAQVVSSLQDALRPSGSSPDGALGDGDMWVIGGEQVFAQALPLADRCEVTQVDVPIVRDDTDVMAPVLDEGWIAEDADWQTSSSGLRYRFSTYRRIS
ncbi:MAG: dihydrofolate reductase [Mycobacteriaceae bacterium]|nr:dihydrofolate reductase [Mycobacteriaceae bacterium]MBV9638087.1 dihydrofolate reductase [Mycobacteriaceae bacterium]